VISTTAKIFLVFGVLAAASVAVMVVYRWWKNRHQSDTLAQAAEELARRDVERAKQDAEIARVRAEAEARKKIQAEQDAAKGRKHAGTLSDTLNRNRADTKP
jgi:hypothetical protein